jgi:hypothetical protein
MTDIEVIIFPPIAVDDKKCHVEIIDGGHMLIRNFPGDKKSIQYVESLIYDDGFPNVTCEIK